MKSKIFVAFIAAIALCAAMTFPTGTSASHSWNNYHWARTSNPFNLKVVDSNTTDWDDNLNAANAAWSSSSVLNMLYEAGDSSSRARKR